MPALCHWNWHGETPGAWIVGLFGDLSLVEKLHASFESCIESLAKPGF
jgi:hypothetical protein